MVELVNFGLDRGGKKDESERRGAGWRGSVGESKTGKFRGKETRAPEGLKNKCRLAGRKIEHKKVSSKPK